MSLTLVAIILGGGGRYKIFIVNVHRVPLVIFYGKNGANLEVNNNTENLNATPNNGDNNSTSFEYLSIKLKKEQIITKH